MERIGERNREAGLNFSRRGMLGAIAATAASAGIGAPAWARAQANAATQALIDRYVAEGKVPGAIVGIMERGAFRPTWLTAGKTLFEGGGAPNPDTLWRVYSMTKPITGIAVMQQIAAGKLTLDTPIADIMPEFRTMQVLLDPAKGLEAAPAKKPILVRHLLTHTAGFSYTLGQPGPLEKEYIRLGLNAVPTNLSLGYAPQPTPPLTEYMKRLATLPLRTEPGTKWHYSIALDVAGGLLERLTGKTFDKVLEEGIFAPLGMKSTGFQVPAANASRLSGLYAWQDGKPKLIDGPQKSGWTQKPDFLAGGAGLVSSASDYARFGQAMLNEGLFERTRILPTAFAKIAMGNQMEPGVLMDPWNGYASGGNTAIYETSGPEGAHFGRWGWGGAACTLFSVDPVRGQSIVLMLQSLGNPNGPQPPDLTKARNADAA